MNGVTDQPGYLLHRRRYRETSLLIDALTLDYGRVSFIAKGVSKKGWDGSLQLFQPLRLSWSGRSQLKNLTQVESASASIPLAGLRLYCGFYVNELLLKLYPESDSNPMLFAAYVKALADLCSDNIEASLRRFEMQLLNTLGLVPDLVHEGHGMEIIQAQRRYQWDIRRGFYVVPSGGIPGEHLQILEREGLDYAPLKGPAKQLMRMAIDSALNGKILKSREMIRQMKAAR